MAIDVQSETIFPDGTLTLRDTPGDFSLTLKSLALTDTGPGVNHSLTFQVAGDADRSITLTEDVTLPQASSGPTLSQVIALARGVVRY